MIDETPRLTAVRLVINNAEAWQPPPEPDPDPDPPPWDEPPPRPEDNQGSGDPPPPPSAPLPDGLPVVPLGLTGDQYHYLDDNRQLRTLKAEKHGHLNLRALFGRHTHLLKAHWPRKKQNRDSGEWETVGWKPEELADALMRACAAAGIWSPFGRVRGVGSWAHDDGRLVLHCGDQVLIGPAALPGDAAIAADQMMMQVLRPGVLGRHVYPAAEPQPRPWDQAVDAAPAAALLARLRTWAWKRPELDAHLMLCWIGAGLLGGALDWRPSAWVTGDKSTGKSTLHQLIERLLGAHARVGGVSVSAASIWQTLGYACLPVCVDQLEADEDNRSAKRVIELARDAASGGVIMRGGADHNAVQFHARSCFLFSSVLIPPMRGAEKSRLAILELQPLPEGAPAPVLDLAELGELGRKLRRRLLDQWPRFAQTFRVYRAALAAAGHGGRSGDQFGTLLACGDLLLSDAVPAESDDGVQEWVAALAPTLLPELLGQEADHAKCVDHLTSWVQEVRGVMRPLASLIAEAAYRELDEHPPPDPELLPHVIEQQQKDRARAAAAVLLPLGLKVVCREGAWYLAVANSHQGVARIFQQSHWAGQSGATGVHVQALRRVPGAIDAPANLRFGAKAYRAVLVPLDAVLGPEGGG